MSYGVDYGFEHRALGELRHIDTLWLLPGSDLHIFTHECQAIQYLSIDRAREVRRIHLICRVVLEPAMGDGLDPGTPDPMPGFSRT